MINLKHITLILLLLISGGARADSTPKLITIHGHWQVILFHDNNNRSCTISNRANKPKAHTLTADEQKLAEDEDRLQEAQTALAKEASRANAYFFITSWPQRSEYLALSARSPILLHDHKPSWLLFPDNSRFSLTQEGVYLKSEPKNRARILRLLRKHKNLQMVNYDQDNKEHRANFNLKGIDAALAALLQYCPLPQ